MSITVNAYYDNTIWNGYSAPEPSDLDVSGFKLIEASSRTKMVFETLYAGQTVKLVMEGAFSQTYAAGTSWTTMISGNGDLSTGISFYVKGLLWQEELYSPAVDPMLLVTADKDPTLLKLKELYRGDDTFIASTASDISSNDGVFGFGGDDVYYGFGSPSNQTDYFYGGDGVDTSVYRGKIADYTVLSATNIWNELTLKNDGVGHFVTDGTANRDGVDGLVDVERLLFADYGLAFDADSANSAGGIYRLYQAAFDRKPDLSGLGYWIAAADNGKSAVRMGEDFTWSGEFQSVYNVKITDNYATGANVQNLVKGFYNNVLGRDPDVGGLNYYTGVIQSHEKTVGRVLAEISDSPENYTLVASSIADGIRYTPYTAQAMTPVHLIDDIKGMVAEPKIDIYQDVYEVNLVGQTQDPTWGWAS